MFSTAKEAAGLSTDQIAADTLDALLAEARSRYGNGFSAVLRHSRVWINGEVPARAGETALREHDEIAILPPVAGG